MRGAGVWYSGVGTGPVSGPPNLRLLLSRFAMVVKGRSPCSEPPRATSIAAQQNR